MIGICDSIEFNIGSEQPYPTAIKKRAAPVMKATLYFDNRTD